MKKLVLLSIVWMFILYSGVVSAAPGDYCGYGKVRDCVGKCVSASTANNWANDNYCDDGAWGMDLICSAFNYDGGACDEDGDTCSSATPVDVNTITPGIIDSGGDYDYFAIDLPSAGTLTVYTTGSSDTYGYLKSSSCSQIRYNDDSGPNYNFQITQDLPAGTYYVGIRHYSSARTGEYELNIEFTPADDHGDDCSSATPVDLNTITDGDIEEGGDYDYVTVDVPKSGTLRVFTTGNKDTYGYLKNSVCRTINSNDDSGEDYNFKISRDVNAGTYYIAVRNYSPTARGSYELNVEFISNEFRDFFKSLENLYGIAGTELNLDALLFFPGINDYTQVTWNLNGETVNGSVLRHTWNQPALVDVELNAGGNLHNFVLHIGIDTEQLQNAPENQDFFYTAVIHNEGRLHFLTFDPETGTEQDTDDIASIMDNIQQDVSAGDSAYLEFAMQQESVYEILQEQPFPDPSSIEEGIYGVFNGEVVFLGRPQQMAESVEALRAALTHDINAVDYDNAQPADIFRGIENVVGGFSSEALDSNRVAFPIRGSGQGLLTDWMQDIISPMHAGGRDYLSSYGPNLSFGNDAGLMVSFNPTDLHFSSRMGSRSLNHTRHAANRLQEHKDLLASKNTSETEKINRFQMAMDGGDSDPVSNLKNLANDIWDDMSDGEKLNVGIVGGGILLEALENGTELKTPWIDIPKSGGMSIQLSGQRDNYIKVEIKGSFTPDCSKTDCGPVLPFEYPNALRDRLNMRERITMMRIASWVCIRAYCTEEDYGKNAGHIPAASPDEGVIDPSQDQQDSGQVIYGSYGEFGLDDAPGGVTIGFGPGPQLGDPDLQNFAGQMQWYTSIVSSDVTDKSKGAESIGAWMWSTSIVSSDSALSAYDEACIQSNLACN